MQNFTVRLERHECLRLFSTFESWYGIPKTNLEMRVSESLHSFSSNLPTGTRFQFT